jgi:Subtilase family
MQEPNMNGFFFEPRRDGAKLRPDPGDSAPGLISLPAALLQRYGARVLNPEHAVEIPGREPPRPTVYRARTLLVPGDVITNQPDVIKAVNLVLARVGIELIAPPVHDDPELRRVNADIADALLQLPRRAVLKPAPPTAGEPVRPQVVDAWVALQTLRAAASPKPSKLARAAKGKLYAQTVERFELEHIMISSSLAGSPVRHGGGGLTGDPGDGNGVTGPSSTDSYVFRGGDTRVPVALCLDAPKRMDLKECTDRYGRRPVVAVLDTGIRQHAWLDVGAWTGNEYPTDHSNGFVETDPGIQHAIYEEGKLAALRDRHQLIEHAWDRPITEDPLVGELGTDTGHCTFISGIVRQIAPDARVLALRVMHGDGLVYEGDLLCGLRHLARRIALAQKDKRSMARMVDVVSLSLGYFSESEPAAFTSGLRQVLGVLLGLGVAVVAAAGNYSTSRRFLPAGFAETPASSGQVPLISVGALNPNGSKAIFSDGGSWITAWARGAVMISTFPVDIQGSQNPELSTRPHPGHDKQPAGVPVASERESLDPDDYQGGFAAWSGTSFSAPLLAAHIARSLLEDKRAARGIWLNDPGADAAKRRTLAALKSLGWPG